MLVDLPKLWRAAITVLIPESQVLDSVGIAVIPITAYLWRRKAIF
jgi:hypothetical protein